jgi:hypothetical protein
MEIEQEVVDCVNDLVNKVVKKEQNRLSQRKYRNNNKQKEKQRNKEYREKNKEKIKQYLENNKEKIKEGQKQYNQTLEGKKICKIAHWKHRGIITDDYDALYYHYLNTAYCDACRVKLTYDRYNTATTKCVDHDHKIRDAFNFRNILCNSCNIKRK